MKFGFITKLFLIGLLFIGIISFSSKYSYSKIEEDKEQQKKELLLKEVLPQAEKIKNFSKNGIKYNIGFADGKKIGTAVIVSYDGYSGPIEMIIGIDSKGKIINIAIMSHNETPGLGSRIEEEKFIGQFKGKNIKDMELRSQDGRSGKIDAITQATVSSNAVVEGAKKAFKLFKKIKD